MRVLVLEGKHGLEMWDASTPEKEAASYLALFREMNEQGDYECCPPEKNCRNVFELAKKGDAKAARAFLNHRSSAGYEYETLSVYEVRDPLAVKQA